MIASWQTIIAATPVAFLLGLFSGWIISQRYAIIRRNGEPGESRRATDKGEPDG